MSWKRASPSAATVGSPLPLRGVMDALYWSRFALTAAPPNAADEPPIAVIVSGLSIANSTSTPARGYSPPLFLIVGLTTTLSPGLAVYSPKSMIRFALDAFLFAETSDTSPKLTVGCTVDIPPAALTGEANALVMSVALMTKDVTAESSFFISAFPFRAFRSYLAVF